MNTDCLAQSLYANEIDAGVCAKQQVPSRSRNRWNRFNDEGESDFGKELNFYKRDQRNLDFSNLQNQSMSRFNDREHARQSSGERAAYLKGHGLLKNNANEEENERQTLRNRTTRGMELNEDPLLQPHSTSAQDYPLSTLAHREKHLHSSYPKCGMYPDLRDVECVEEVSNVSDLMEKARIFAPLNKVKTVGYNPAAQKTSPTLRQLAGLPRDLKANELMPNVLPQYQGYSQHNRPNNAYSQKAQDSVDHVRPGNAGRDQEKATDIEIMPGIYAPLRGSKETWNAVEDGRVVFVDCMSCSNPLICISDAEYILCPDCRVISPVIPVTITPPWVGSYAIRRGGSMSSSRGGVGLGLKTSRSRRNIFA